MVSHITSLTIVYSTIYPGADQRKHQWSALLAFVRGIRRWPVNSPHKWPVTRKMFPFDDVIMIKLDEIVIADCTGSCRNNKCQSHLRDVPHGNLQITIQIDTECWRSHFGMGYSKSGQNGTRGKMERRVYWKNVLCYVRVISVIGQCGLTQQDQT